MILQGLKWLEICQKSLLALVAHARNMYSIFTWIILTEA